MEHHSLQSVQVGPADLTGVAGEWKWEKNRSEKHAWKIKIIINNNNNSWTVLSLMGQN